MIKRIAAVTAKWLLQAGAISASDVELYEYSIYSFLFTLCPLGLVLIISVFLHMVVEGILLIIPFIIIRKFCGGFHFQSSILAQLREIGYAQSGSDTKLFELDQSIAALNDKAACSWHSFS